MDDDLRARYRQPAPTHHRTSMPSGRPNPIRVTNLSQPKTVPTRPVVPVKEAVSFELPTPIKKRGKFTKSIKVILGLILFLIMVFFVIKLWLYPKYSQYNPFPAQIKNSANFQLYYPTKLPSGFKVDPNSFHSTTSEIVFNALNNNTKLVFTQQKVPSSFDFNGFYARQVSSPTSFTTSYGKVVIGGNDNRILGSMVAGQTWLLLTTNSSTPSVDDMALILKNLKQY